MKNVLLGTSAIAAAVAFANPAAAQMDVTIGGYMIAEYGFMDSDVDTQNSGEMRLEHELVFRGDAVSDNGLEYGFKTELQNSGDDNGTALDEASLYVGGSWGLVEMGDFDGPADALAFYAPIVGEIEQIDGDYVEFADATAQPFGFLSGVDSSDSTKIAYTTPVFNGFQAGIAYAPQMDSEGQDVVVNETLGDYEDVIEAGLAYTGTTDNFNYGVSLTVTDASAVDSAALEDFTAWSLGAQIGFGGWTIGGAYSDNDEVGNAAGDNQDNKGWNLGVAYENGPWAVAAQYADGEGNTDGATVGGVTYDYADDYTTYGIGAVYQVAPGLTVEGDLVFFDIDYTNGVTTDSNDGYVAILATRVTF